jgi:hypothetical protein
MVSESNLKAAAIRLEDRLNENRQERRTNGDPNSPDGQTGDREITRKL